MKKMVLALSLVLVAGLASAAFAHDGKKCEGDKAASADKKSCCASAKGAKKDCPEHKEAKAETKTPAEKPADKPASEGKSGS